MLVDLVVLMLAGQTNFAMTLDLSLPTSRDRLFCRAMVEHELATCVYDGKDNIDNSPGNL